jgi:hypothetical protein
MIKLMSKGALIVIILLVLAGGAFATLKITQNQTTNNESEKQTTEEITPSSSVSQSPVVPLPVSEALINDQLKSYLPRILEPAYNGKVFCSSHLYGFDENKSTNMVQAYVWAYCEEYFQENGQIKMGSGVSEPVLVTLELQNGILGVQGHQEPGNGSLYAPSIKEMFPEKYYNEVIKGYLVAQFKPSPKEQAEEYYAE